MNSSNNVEQLPVGLRIYLGRPVAPLPDTQTEDLGVIMHLFDDEPEATADIGATIDLIDEEA